MKAGDLRKKYPEFAYKGYAYELRKGDLEMSFHFEVGEITFRPKVFVRNVSRSRLNRVGKLAMENFVFHLGLAEMPSYWKATASPKIIVEAGHLDKAQINWWHDLFMKGMSQYFYENTIDFRPRNFFAIEPSCDFYGRGNRTIGDMRYAKKLPPQILIPVGGGKDAAVTLELLGEAMISSRPLLLNPKTEQLRIAGLARTSKPVIVERAIDQTLLELNRSGYLNGHTPFSAYLAFLSTLCSALFGYKYIALSNERSSNEGNVKYLGKVINHQYSKSFEFEKKFRQYSKKYLAKNIEYFSFLRPLYELQIAKLFARHPKYFATFLSCNEAHKTYSGKRKPRGKWCGTCPKCLFVFASLYPFMETKRIVTIFGSNLFEDRSLIALMEELTGEKRFKPFECVGTAKESLAAFYLCLQKTYPPLPALLKHFRTHIARKHPSLPQDAKALLSSWSEIHALPPRFKHILSAATK